MADETALNGVAGIDRVAVLPGKTYLRGWAGYGTAPAPRKGPGPQTAPPPAPSGPAVTSVWSKDSGPGSVTFADPKSPITTATFTAPGEYVLKLTVDNGQSKASSTLNVSVETPPPAKQLDAVYTKNFKIDSPLWNARAKALIVNWIPHCIDQINRTDLTQGPGGIDNFVEAGKALRGEPHGAHKGYVFANAWVHQTVEAMCIALMVDPQGDRGNHQGAGENEGDARGLDSENSRRAGAGWLFANGVHAAEDDAGAGAGPFALGPAHAAITKATPPDISSSRPSIITR